MKSITDAVCVYRDGREVCDVRTTEGRAEYMRRIAVMRERQRHVCCLCYRPIRLSEAVFEHEAGRGFNGSHRDDRITLPDGTWQNGASCWECNSQKASRRMRYNR